MNDMHQGTFKLSVIGLIASIALTLAAYAAVVGHLLSGSALMMAIMALALAQMVVQLLCFLDLGFESGSRWRLATFLSTVVFILVIVVGSIWIMSHLNYNMMASPEEMTRYIQSQQGF